MQLIRFENISPSHWKNGLGITYQIDIYPKEADFFAGSYLYRLSMAKVTCDNDFSVFEKKWRFLKIIEGKGLYLNDEKLLNDEALFFNGEEKIHSRLLDNKETVLDLGIIYDPKKIVLSEIKEIEKINDSFFRFYFINLKENKKIFNFEVNYLDTLVFENEEWPMLKSHWPIMDTIIIGLKIIG